MTFMEAIQTCFRKYVVWRGRAERPEYWWFVLFTFAASIVLSIVDVAAFNAGPNDFGLFGGLFSLATFLPSLSVLVRRLHDTDRSGWWFWLILIPLVGWIILIVFLASKGTDGPNRFDDDASDNRRNGEDDDQNYTSSSIPTVNRD